MIDWTQVLIMAGMGAVVGGGIAALYVGIRMMVTSGKEDKKRK
jgi:hypothetical protein